MIEIRVTLNDSVGACCVLNVDNVFFDSLGMYYTLKNDKTHVKFKPYTDIKHVKVVKK